MVFLTIRAERPAGRSEKPPGAIQERWANQDRATALAQINVDAPERGCSLHGHSEDTLANVRNYWRFDPRQPNCITIMLINVSHARRPVSTVSAPLRGTAIRAACRSRNLPNGSATCRTRALRVVAQALM